MLKGIPERVMRGFYSGALREATGARASHKRRRAPARLPGQAEDELLPPLLEGVHVRLAEDFLERLEACWVCRVVGVEVFVEADEEAALLQVVAEVSRLRVVGPALVLVEVARVHREQGLKRGEAAAADGALESGQAPVGVADDAPARLPALLVEGAQALVEPRRTVGEVGLDEGVDYLVDERAAAGLDVHHERLVRRGVVAVGRRRLAAEEAFGVRAV